MNLVGPNSCRGWSKFVSRYTSVVIVDDRRMPMVVPSMVGMVW